MAKVTAPLFSFTARGKLADSLVFFPWKGIAVVRKYVVPAYSDTPLQIAQRTILREAVALIHTAQARALNPLDVDDQTAYSALAAAKNRIITWFNQAVKLAVDSVVAANTEIIYSNGFLISSLATSFEPFLALNEGTPADLTVGNFYLGTSKTNLIQSLPGIVTPGLEVRLGAGAGFAGLTVGKKYFWQFRPTADPLCLGADSGIYYGYAT